MVTRRIDPKTRRLIVSDLTPSIKGSIVTLQEYADYMGVKLHDLQSRIEVTNKEIELTNLYLEQASRIKRLEDVLKFDAMSGALVGISSPHHRIHEGDSFTTNFTDATLADAETIILAFKTAKTPKLIHLFIFFSSLVGGSLDLWEGVTWTTNTGTTNPIINRLRTENRKPSGAREDKTATPAFTATGNVLSNPTLTGGVVTPTGATLLDKQYAWGERGKIGAGFLRDEHEFVLNSDTQYAAVFTAIGASNKATVSLNWYETIDKK